MIDIFKNSNFTKLFIGRIITNIGDSLYVVATMWLVYKIGNSSFYTGLAGFLVLLPQSLQFVAGPIIDKFSLRKILIITQVLQGMLVLIIPVAYIFGYLYIPLILTIMPIVSLLDQFGSPAEKATIPVILKKDQLVKGNSLFSFAYQGIEFSFNAIAGLLIILVGGAILLFIDSITFALATLLFASLSLKSVPQAKGQTQKQSIKKILKNYFTDIKYGFHFIFHSLILRIAVGSFVTNAIVCMMEAILPAYSSFRGGAGMYGAYLAATSGGMVLGAFIGTFFTKYPVGRLFIFSFFLGGMMWLLSVLTPWSLVSLILLGGAYIPIGITNVMLITVMQNLIPSHLLGRVFTANASLVTAGMPLGSLIGGILGSFINANWVFLLTGCGFVFLSAYWFALPILRKLPQVDEITI
ncbi:MAG: MFS transporter [Sporolactobacillus sp.]